MGAGASPPPGSGRSQEAPAAERAGPFADAHDPAWPFAAHAERSCPADYRAMGLTTLAMQLLAQAVAMAA